MSGGVDSLGAAILLLEQGYDVTGITFVNWNEKTKGVIASKEKPTPEQSAVEAKKLCDTLGIPHHTVDLCEEFEIVLDYFSESYLKGETPNPCIFCNRNFKFKHLAAFADRLGITKIATGHYAGVKSENQRYYLYRAFDDWKDQTFMLWNLPQSILSRCVFPLSGLMKEKVKEMVGERGFATQSKNRESFNLCFVPDDDYKQFLIRRNSDKFDNLSNGDVLDEKGVSIGTHEGYPFYTIGQSKGFQINSEKRKYIYKINSVANTLQVADKQKLYQTKIRVDSLNFQKQETMSGKYRLFVRIRGKDIGMFAEVTFDNLETEVVFEQPVFAPAVGQSAVFYEGNAVVCGGTIC